MVLHPRSEKQDPIIILDEYAHSDLYFIHDFLKRPIQNKRKVPGFANYYLCIYLEICVTALVS